MPLGTKTAELIAAPMRIVFMGTPEFAIPVLEKLHGSPDCEVVAVYTTPDRPRGRGRGVQVAPVKAAAGQLELPVFQPSSFRSEDAQRALAALRPDVIVVAAYGKLLPLQVLEQPALGCLNIHPSLLPRYRGPSPVVSSIIDGVSVTGVSLMLLDEGMDTGPVIVQRERLLERTDTADYLTRELFDTGANLLVETLGPWAAGQLKATPQDESLATVTRKLERDDGRADWGQSAPGLERRRRAFTPWPGLFTEWRGKSLKLVDVSTEFSLPESGVRGDPAPGEVVALPLHDVPVGIGTAGGILGIKTVQLEGRRATASAEFVRGYPDFIGSRL